MTPAEISMLEHKYEEVQRIKTKMKTLSEQITLLQEAHQHFHRCGQEQPDTYYLTVHVHYGTNRQLFIGIDEAEQNCVHTALLNLFRDRYEYWRKQLEHL